MSSSDNTSQADPRSRLLEAATAAFLEEGYRVSVDRIAARAGVAKQTLYNHFSGKEELFSEVVRQGTAAMLVALDGDDEPLRERLLRFAYAFRSCVLGEVGIAFFRIIAAEASRFPELTAAFYANGPEQTTQRLAAVLERAMAAGELRRDEPVFAAKMLLAMLAECQRTERLFACTTVPEPDAAEVAPILDLFLRAFAPPTP